MEDIQKRVHEAIEFFFRELPQFLESSVVQEDRTLVIKLDFPHPTRGTFEKPKKNAPPSRIWRNRLRLARFLERSDTNIQTG